MNDGASRPYRLSYPSNAFQKVWRSKRRKSRTLPRALRAQQPDDTKSRVIANKGG